jgi:hypothetical protein
MCLGASFLTASQTPLEFNDKLTAITDSAYVLGKEWGIQFIEAHKKKDYGSLQPYREKIEQYIEAEIAVVEGMKDVRDSRALRMAMIQFLKYEKNMIEKAFAPLERLGKYTPQSEIQAYLERIKAYSIQEEEELGKVNAAQEAFARANGFKIEVVTEDK